MNDLYGEVVILFRMILECLEELSRAIKLTHHSREEYYQSYSYTDGDLERARRLIVRLWQGRGGKTSHRTGWRSMIELNGPLLGKEWLKFFDKIAVVAERLIGVQIENQPAFELIEGYRTFNLC